MACREARVTCSAGAEHGHLAGLGKVWRAWRAGIRPPGATCISSRQPCRFALRRAGGPVGDDPPLIDEGKGVTLLCFVHVVGRHQDGGPGRRPWSGSDPRTPGGRSGPRPPWASSRKRTGGWWMTAQAIARRWRSPPGRSCARASRFPVRPPMTRNLFASGRRLSGGQAVDAGEEVEVLLNGQLFVKGELFGHVADVLPHLFGSRATSYPATLPTPELGSRIPRHPDGGGLAGAVGSQEAEHLAPPDLEAYPVHGHELAEALAEGPSPGWRGRVHAGLTAKTDN